MADTLEETALRGWRQAQEAGTWGLVGWEPRRSQLQRDEHSGRGLLLRSALRWLVLPQPRPLLRLCGASAQGWCGGAQAGEDGEGARGTGRLCQVSCVADVRLGQLWDSISTGGAKALSGVQGFPSWLCGQHTRAACSLDSCLGDLQCPSTYLRL